MASGRRKEAPELYGIPWSYAFYQLDVGPSLSVAPGHGRRQLELCGDSGRNFVNASERCLMKCLSEAASQQEGEKGRALSRQHYIEMVEVQAHLLRTL